MAKKKPKRSYTTTTLDSSGYIEGGGVRALPHNLWVDIKRNKVLYVCLTFILAFFVIFSFLPLVGLLMAFERYSPVKGFFGSQWVGLQNFETFFSGPYVGRLIRNTLAIGVLNLVVNFPAPIIFALILNEIKNKYFKKIVQTISYMPYFVSAVVACGIVVDFTEAGGAISTFVASITGSEPQNLLNQGTNFWLIYVLQNMWQGLGYFAANEQETYRRGSAKLENGIPAFDAVDSLVSERALRELYLKPFQMAVEAGLHCVMTSFNKVNGTFAGGSKDLCTHILREEWGFDGVVVTDWGDMDIVVDGAEAVAAGNDIIMPGGPPVIQQILKGKEENRLTRQKLEIAVEHLLSVLRRLERLDRHDTI